jgi:hypothetical protein
VETALTLLSEAESGEAALIKTLVSEQNRIGKSGIQNLCSILISKVNTSLRSIEKG